MSFGESLFSARLFQKTTKRDLFVKEKFRIKNGIYARRL
jgi:hypothetical protein